MAAPNVQPDLDWIISLENEMKQSAAEAAFIKAQHDGFQRQIERGNDAFDHAIASLENLVTTIVPD